MDSVHATEYLVLRGVVRGVLSKAWLLVASYAFYSLVYLC